jgi:hypothetical protein
MTIMAAPARGSLRELVLYFLRLGLLGFGGPVALVGQMERELVADRGRAALRPRSDHVGGGCHLQQRRRIDRERRNTGRVRDDNPST